MPPETVIPSLDVLSSRSGVPVKEEESSDYRTLVEFVFAAAESAMEKPITRPDLIDAVRITGLPVDAESDPLNAVINRVSVKATQPQTSSLEGVRIGVKDCIRVAGVPMTAGSTLLSDFIAEDDSVAVQRLLNAGAEIVATLNLDGFSWAGSADTSSFGRTLNPFDITRSAAGSSGGSAAALYYDWIDAALGTDQGGSIRQPSAWCGVLGLKPTMGLVPYDGCLGMDNTLDNIGPMTRTASMMGRLMHALVQPPDQTTRIATPDTGHDFLTPAREPDADLKGVRIGVLVEGITPERRIDPRNIAAVNAAIHELEKLGAVVNPVSVPEHDLADAHYFALAALSTAMTLHLGGNGYGTLGRYFTDLPATLGPRLRDHATELPGTVKTALLAAAAIDTAWPGGQVAATVGQWRQVLRAAYDRALSQVDYLIMPCSRTVATPFREFESVQEKVLADWSALANTQGMNLTGHPALTMPLAEVDGLPVGVMLVGRHAADAAMIGVAATIEATIGWQPMQSPRFGTTIR